MEVAESELQELYTWVDDIPLSRPKRNISRDFSDGVLMAEVVAHFFPKLVELHNYSSANATQQKMYNWNTLNQKVFKRLGFTLSKAEFEAVANCQPGSVERVLKMLKVKLAKAQAEGLTIVPNSTAMVPNAAAVVSAHGPAAPAAVMTSKEPPPYVPVHAPAAVARPYPGSLGPAVAMAAPKVANKAGLTGLPSDMLAEKEQMISELKETNEILETKVRKLEQLVRLKDAKISTLMAKLQSAGLA